MSLLIALLLVLNPQTGTKPRPRPPAAPARPSAPAAPVYFTSPLPVEEMRGKQAVLETSMGAIVIDLLPDAAPNHVAHFIVRAREHAYDGTVFHRVQANALVQAGDPLSKDPAQKAKYGTGGLNELRFEPNAEKQTRGTVSAILAPGKPDSGGSQFFICVGDQPGLNGQYTAFGRVAEGLALVQKISQVPADGTGVPNDRVEIRSVVIRDTPAPQPEPFTTETVEQLSSYRAVIESPLGNIALEFFPDRAPNHVRNFLRLAATGVYDGTAFHRVAKGFVIQGGHLPTRKELLDERQQGFIRNLQPEFNPTLHDKGILSMARLSDPASASSSFFIVTARSEGLDGQYTVFGRVADGLDVVEKIEAVRVVGETPIERVDVTRVRVEKRP